MERITKSDFMLELTTAKNIALLFGGYVEEEKVMNNIEKILQFKCSFDRSVFRLKDTELIFKFSDGSYSHLRYDQKCDGRIHYKIGDVLIREELHNDYKPNFCIYKVSGKRDDIRS